MGSIGKSQGVTLPTVRFQEENVAFTRFEIVFRIEPKVERSIGQVNKQVEKKD